MWDDNTSGAEPIEPGTTIDVGRAQHPRERLRLAGDPASFHTDGPTGTQLAYVGAKAQGRAWVAVDERNQTSIVVFAPSAPETFQQVSGQVDDMVDSIRVAGAGA